MRASSRREVGKPGARAGKPSAPALPPSTSLPAPAGDSSRHSPTPPLPGPRQDRDARSRAGVEGSGAQAPTKALLPLPRHAHPTSATTAHRPMRYCAAVRSAARRLRTWTVGAPRCPARPAHRRQPDSVHMSCATALPVDEGLVHGASNHPDLGRTPRPTGPVAAAPAALFASRGICVAAPVPRQQSPVRGWIAGWIVGGSPVGRLVGSTVGPMVEAASRGAGAPSQVTPAGQPVPRRRHLYLLGR